MTWVTARVFNIKMMKTKKAQDLKKVAGRTVQLEARSGQALLTDFGKAQAAEADVQALDAQPKAAADTALLKADEAQLVDDQATKDILREGEYFQDGFKASKYLRDILKDVGINENSVTEFLKLLTRHNAALLREPKDEVLLTKYFSTQWKAGVRNGHIGPAPATGENAAGRSAARRGDS